MRLIDLCHGQIHVPTDRLHKFINSTKKEHNFYVTRRGIKSSLAPVNLSIDTLAVILLFLGSETFYVNLQFSGVASASVSILQINFP